MAGALDTILDHNNVDHVLKKSRAKRKVVLSCCFLNRTITLALNLLLLNFEATTIFMKPNIFRYLLTVTELNPK